MKNIILLTVTCFAFSGNAQTLLDSNPIPYPQDDVVYFLDGHKADSSMIGKLKITDIHSADFCLLYGYPSGAIYFRTNHFINDLRPEFYRNLRSWVNDPQKIFSVDESPLSNKKIMLTIPENNIEGFTIIREGDKERIEIVLSSGYALNFR